MFSHLSHGDKLTSLSPPPHLRNKRAQVHLQGKDMAKGEKGPKPKKGRKSFGKQAEAC